MMNKKIITTLCGNEGRQLFEHMAGEGEFSHFEDHLISASLELDFIANGVEWDSFSLLEFDQDGVKGVCFFPKGHTSMSVFQHDFSVLAFGVVITIKALESYMKVCDSDVLPILESARSLILDFVYSRSDAGIILSLCA